jgi:formate--tetrahydrofolate ligase
MSEGATALAQQHLRPRSDIDVAQSATMRPIGRVARDKLGIPEGALYAYGPHKAKLSLDYVRSLDERPDGKLILVTAIAPTPAGEGKTTTTVGLGDALNHIGERAATCWREPSLGLSFGIKGGAAGGGYAQGMPVEDINLHFTGDFHAIGTANDLLAALIDNHVYWANELGIDTRRISWRRALDMNGRALRAIVSSLGGTADDYPREDGFDIVVASEVMAIYCLATELEDLQRRLGNIIVAQGGGKNAIRAADLTAAGPMTALLRDAIAPYLVQTLEGNPAFIHGGPFANIAHGCNSVIATRTALKLADYVVTEAGFGADPGAEKFFDIKCRKSGLTPGAAVLVATVRALKMHGGVAKDALKQENLAALEAGFANLARYIANVRGFGLPAIVAVNRFSADTPAQTAGVRELGRREGVDCVLAASGGAGAAELARSVIRTIAASPVQFRLLYPDDMPLFDKTRIITQRLYGAADIAVDHKTRERFTERQGFGHFPVCMAKTQSSFTTDPNSKGAPSGHVIPVRELRLSAGAEFVVAIGGDIMTMPGLPKVPAANTIAVTESGRIAGLF